MSASLPKYALAEVERRWLVFRGAVPDLSACVCRVVEDKYLAGGHLRVRSVREANGTKVCKLGKKYPSVVTGQAPVVSVYLSEPEASALWSLAGRFSRKQRYTLEGGARRSLAMLPIRVLRLPRPNPSLHPKCYSGLHPLPHSGELKR
jgi:hypothetical protein